MKYRTLAGTLLLTQLSSPAQQLELRSALHQDQEKVTIYQEWPQRHLIDTLRLSGGVLHYRLPEGPAVYSLRLRKPFADITLLSEKGQVLASILPGTQVVIQGWPLQQQWLQLKESLRPLENEWAEVGHRYEQAKDLEAKPDAGKDMDRFARETQQRQLDFTKRHAADLAGAWSAFQYAYAWTPASLQQLIPFSKTNPGPKLPMRY